jgi:hypothetical protein
VEIEFEDENEGGVCVYDTEDFTETVCDGVTD